MKVVVLGGTGWIGAEIAAESVRRGHETIVMSRHPEDIKYTLTPDILSLKADAASLEELNCVMPDNVDVLVNSLIPDPFNHETFTDWCENVIQCCKEKKVKRLISIIDSCVFKVSHDKTIKDTMFLTPLYREWFGEHENTHKIYENEKELSWVEIAPAAKCFPDKQLKQYMIAVDSLCTIDVRVRNLETPNPDTFQYGDTSYISTQDFAYAVLDEIEQHRYERQRICVAWEVGHEMCKEGDK